MDLVILKRCHTGGRASATPQFPCFLIIPMTGRLIDDYRFDVYQVHIHESTISKSQIRELISDGNINALEELVLQGQGDRLLGETSAIPKVQSFLNIVPMYMERIYDVHRAVMRDQLEHVVILLENRKLAMARDQLGATPLHKAVWFGHYKIAHFISQQFPETLNAIDMEGRTALHYAAALKDNKNMYGILIEAGANKGIYDNKGKTADYYSQYPEHLNLEEVIKRCHKVNANYLANTASRIKGKSPVRQTPPPSNGNLSNPQSEENNDSTKVDKGYFGMDIVILNLAEDNGVSTYFPDLHNKPAGGSSVVSLSGARDIT
ncbi:hypothetical protein AVEN_65239-1 [Araneus ventricosus]|uniref:Uncharacterized protein n=1 Tax=Araneus ventricosus TaxID=182803 RepID=A0A4Y2AGD3_ARAVE|nr:hypothetical protein AVEN_65239-1 [Araneus ventricosus]